MNVKTFLKDETFPADKAEELGLYLGIEPGRISTLKKNNNNDADCLLSEIITEWLNNDDEKSWDKLATALRNCNYSVMADKLKKTRRRKRYMPFMSHSYMLSNKLLEKQPMTNMTFLQKQKELNQKTQGSSQCRDEDPLKSLL